MEKMINYGIDLGTTNSVIAKYEAGEVKLYKNPVGLKDTLPSVVAFRNGRTLVGDKARAFITKDPENTFFAFKRKMGTTDSFYVPSLDREIDPIALSSIVLKELKTFETTDEIKQAVITIPASFDTVQSNATKQAGYDAGFDQVFLLQEPIAASLAYVNKGDLDIKKNGKWLVYDLGGGTFDIAVIKVEDGDMTVIDHKGNNFLGGVDIDIQFIEKLIIPILKQEGNFEGIEKELKNKSGKFNKLFFKLMKVAEEAKIELSTKEMVDIEFEAVDLDGNEVDFYHSISKTAFESIITEVIQETIDLTYEVVNANNVGLKDIQQLLLVGGSTYLPKLRACLKEEFKIPINTSIDPTNSVAVGAAYYASSLKADAPKTDIEESEVEEESKLTFQSSYMKSSKLDEEYFALKVEGKIKRGVEYRLTRNDGGFDSGLKTLQEMNSEELTLVENQLNTFQLKVFNKKGKVIYYETIEIAHGNYNIYGQPLPNDICIEIDDPDNATTRLEVVFTKNSILPLKKTITKVVSKPIKKNTEDCLTINLIEGEADAIPSACKPIGIIEIKGEDLNRDLIKRADVEITLEITESRDVKVSAYITMLDQEFSEVFNATGRYVSISLLQEEINELRTLLANEVNLANSNEEYEVSARLSELSEKVDSLYFKCLTLSKDDVTDEKYRIQDEKRKCAKIIHQLTKNKKLTYAQMEYTEARDYCKSYVEQRGEPIHKEEYESLRGMEKSILSSANIARINKLKERFDDLRYNIQKHTPEFAISVFHYYSNPDHYKEKHQKEVKRLVALGDKALEKQNYTELMSVNHALYALYPNKEQQNNKADFGGKTGLV